MNRLKEVRRVQELVYELKIGDAAVTDVLTVPPNMMMSQIRPTLRSRKITAAPAMKDSKPLGIVSVAGSDHHV